jgi:starvation-inducible DNA-binding protein
MRTVARVADQTRIERSVAVTKTLDTPKTKTERGKARPVFAEQATQTQRFGELIPLPIGLPPETCEASVAALNTILADTMVLRDLYKKHHWQIAGASFYQLHLLYDKHYAEQAALVDQLAERIQLLGGVSVATAFDVVDQTRISQAPPGREEVVVQLTRLLEAHELILKDARKVAREADQAGDCGTNDLLVSSVVRTNELEVWFLAEHLVPLPLVEQEG